MKRTNKKGFTLVELVIVIAIIAILAAVLIPTFSGVVERANQSADLQAARNAYTEDLASFNGNYTDGTFTESLKGSITFANGAVKTYVYEGKNYKIAYCATTSNFTDLNLTLVSGSAVAGWNVCKKA